MTAGGHEFSLSIQCQSQMNTKDYKGFNPFNSFLNILTLFSPYPNQIQINFFITIFFTNQTLFNFIAITHI